MFLNVRIILINLFDECMAVGYYDLDLSQEEHRWICRQLLWLDEKEQGENAPAPTVRGRRDAP